MATQVAIRFKLKEVPRNHLNLKLLTFSGRINAGTQKLFNGEATFTTN